VYRVKNANILHHLVSRTLKSIFRIWVKNIRDAQAQLQLTASPLINKLFTVFRDYSPCMYVFRSIHRIKVKMYIFTLLCAELEIHKTFQTLSTRTVRNFFKTRTGIRRAAAFIEKTALAAKILDASRDFQKPGIQFPVDMNGV